MAKPSKLTKHVGAAAKSETVVASATPTVASGSSDEDLKSWDSEFIKFDQGTLFDLILGVKRKRTPKKSSPAAGS